MKKQYTMEYVTKKGNNKEKNVGYNLTDEDIDKLLHNKIKNDNIVSVWIYWSPVGNDVQDSLIGEEFYVKGYAKRGVNILGHTMWFNDQIDEVKK